MNVNLSGWGLNESYHEYESFWMRLGWKVSWMNLHGCSIVWMNIYGWGWYVRYHDWISTKEVNMNSIMNGFLWMRLVWISMDEVGMNGVMYKSL